MCIKNILGKKVTYSLICVFVLLLGCVFVLLVLLVLAKSFRKKNKEFKTALITSFTLLLRFRTPSNIKIVLNRINPVNNFAKFSASGV